MDFGLLHGDLTGLLHLLDLDLLSDDLLLHHIGLELIGLVGGRLLLLNGFEKVGLFDLEIALRFGLRGLRKCFCEHAFFIGLRLGDSGRAHGFGALDRCVALGFGGGHIGVPLDPRNVGPAHVADVFVFVADFLDRERDDLQSHLAHVVGAGGAHAVADHFRLLDDLFHSELSDDAAQVAFHHQADESLALLGRLGEKLFGGGLDRFGI